MPRRPATQETQRAQRLVADTAAALPQRVAMVKPMRRNARSNQRSRAVASGAGWRVDVVSPLPAPPHREATATPAVLSARLLGADSFAVCLTGPFHQQITVLAAQDFLTRSPSPWRTKQPHERWRRPPSPRSARGKGGRWSSLPAVALGLCAAAQL